MATPAELGSDAQRALPAHAVLRRVCFWDSVLLARRLEMAAVLGLCWQARVGHCISGESRREIDIA
eukprot:COSAG01_NODE_2609_length_7389_cov_19.579467_3_plen_66_part_00